MVVKRRKDRSLLDELFRDKFKLQDEMEELQLLFKAKMKEWREIGASIDKEETVLMEGFNRKKVTHDYIFEAGQARKPGKPVV